MPLMRRTLELLRDPVFCLRVHLAGMVIWTALLVPSWIWWRESVFWVIAISHYANIVGHWAALQATRAEDRRNQ